MTRRILALALVLTAGALAGVSPVSAQDWENGLKVDVPFDFVVGSMKMPSGTYVIRRNSGVAANVFEIAGTTNKEMRLFEAEESALQRQPHMRHDELIFTKVGDTYFLSKLDSNAQGSQLLLAEPKSERRLLARGEAVRIDATGALLPSGD